MKTYKNFFLGIILTFGVVKTYSQAGTLDTTYDVNGRVLTNYTPSVYIPDSSIIQPDGKVVLMGRYGIPSSGNKIALTRHNTDGSIDTSFGNNGLVFNDINNSGHGYANGIVLQTDGKLIVCGYFRNSATSISLLLVRYNSNGSMDNNFGTNGVLILAGVEMEGFSIKIQPDNKIVVGGQTVGSQIALVRLNPNGTLDTNFGFNGMVTTAINNNTNYCGLASISILDNGSIIGVGGYQLNLLYSASVIVKYDSNGVLDSAFGNNGVVVTDVNPQSDSFKTQAIQQDGKIIAAGFIANNPGATAVIVRYNTDGSLDNSFGNSGIFTPTVSGGSGVLSMLLQPDNKIIISGSQSLDWLGNYFIARLLSNGTLDTEFNNEGYNVGNFGNVGTTFNSVLMQQDGKLIATGFTQIGNDGYSTIARFNSGLNLTGTNFASNNPINIFPNPVKDFLTISVSENTTVLSKEIYDIAGKHILTDSNYNCNNLNLSDLSTGYYVIKIISNKDTSSFKFFKE